MPDDRACGRWMMGADVVVQVEPQRPALRRPPSQGKGEGVVVRETEDSFVRAAQARQHAYAVIRGQNERLAILAYKVRILPQPILWNPGSQTSGVEAQLLMVS